MGVSISTAVAANNHNNNWRSMPFIEMMVSMLHAMNQVMGGGNSFSNFSNLPYSPAFSSVLFPAMGTAFPNYSRFSNLAMSPIGTNAMPLSNALIDPRKNRFENGANTDSFATQEGNFWDPEEKSFISDKKVKRNYAGNTLNGIWQTLSGDVIAIYNDNHFLWSDGMARNIAGQLMIRGNTMIAYVPAKKITMKFQFYREKNQFIVRDQKLRVYTFKRIH
jgi:hypothetical protein